MPAPIRRRRGTAAAIALTAGVTGAALLLSGCGPDDPTADGTTPPATTGAPTAPVKPVTSSSALNGTAHGGLTISDGTRYVVMNGTRVDFGTLVRDLSWSPDGTKAAFVDGDGDLVVSDPDGSGRVVVAKNPGGQTWSHPTWQTRKADPANGLTALDNLMFAAQSGGTTKLESVPATGGAPQPIGLNELPSDHPDPLPATGNIWPNAGSNGAAAYANPGTGKVYIRDDNIRQQGSAVTTGSEPAMSADAMEDIVFVRSVDGHDHLFLDRGTNNGPTFKDLTPGATTDYTEPAFSPAGDVVAARTPAGIVEVRLDGTGSPVKVSDYKGLPAFRTS
ncbi:hypothetical protein SAMN05216223_105351 [Actinacidiphila yanglinensis]|uniref:WD40-like Beta Propeller Repeat n=1 Tax=Actinacidiphila yanglinensis TaxID=310779 RepID=A0A1H6AEQ6_9ACTN|nr:hypothetical protein [Actinacidiphila yanglinensis]SEG46971.1 hypothetical protein SAMN05216223_105351 [Actinacidiphila yanglinensis]